MLVSVNFILFLLLQFSTVLKCLSNGLFDKIVDRDLNVCYKCYRSVIDMPDCECCVMTV